MFGLGTTEIILIFGVVLLIFGGKKLPEVARGLGRAMREFRKAKDELHDFVSDEAKQAEADRDDKPRPGDGK